ncbi:hypothetical protein KSP40_PGU011646 [Platanthera guangdongensis]|uniref:Gnk2-homologous domain-containing protein n=1 Tax=Platanthera guangdongensis TaxID=2320717 RepID=A0ABR2M8B7_9ASPA
MDFSHQLFLLALLLPLAACINPTYQHCGQNFTGNSILQDNINKTIYSMIANTPDSGYAVSTIGNGSNTVYGLARCRRDIGPKACSDCIVVASQDLRAICPETSASHIWRDLCFLRYEITNFLETIDNSYLKGRRSTKEAELVPLNPRVETPPLSILESWGYRSLNPCTSSSPAYLLPTPSGEVFVDHIDIDIDAPIDEDH